MPPTKKEKRIRNVYDFRFEEATLFDKPQSHLLTNVTLPLRITGRNKLGKQETIIAEIPGDYLQYFAKELHEAIDKYEKKVTSGLVNARAAMKGE